MKIETCQEYPALVAARVNDLEARLALGERLVLQLPCRCINMGDGNYVECARCQFLHGTPSDDTGWFCPSCGIQNGHDQGCKLDYGATDREAFHPLTEDDAQFGVGA